MSKKPSLVFSVLSLFQGILIVTGESPLVHLIITARKRCLGQGNVFTRVCLPPRGGGGSATRGESASTGSASTGVCIQGVLHRGWGWGGGGQTPQDTWDTMGYGQQAGGPHLL